MEKSVIKMLLWRDMNGKRNQQFSSVILSMSYLRDSQEEIFKKQLGTQVQSLEEGFELITENWGFFLIILSHILLNNLPSRHNIA